MSDRSRAKKLYRYRRKAKVVTADHSVEDYLSGRNTADRYEGYWSSRVYFIAPYVRRKGVGIDEIYDWTSDKLWFPSKEDAERFCKYLGKELESE